MVKGSSPLTRGALLRGRLRAGFGGLIPAHAGSTAASPYKKWRTWAHPRSRGEHSSGAKRPPWGGGSSPLTRGARYARGAARIRPGLIPAHAGSTLFRRCMSTCFSAHPRSRGEHVPGCFVLPGRWGSSPLTRGAPARKSGGFGSMRLIPAHAGSTRQCPPRRSSLWAHPRSRGEHLAALRVRDVNVGSSPLTRGARFGMWLPG